MSDRLSLSIFTIEIDGKPTLAFEAKSSIRYPQHLRI
jgi:hypothetical protein